MSQQKDVTSHDFKDRLAEAMASRDLKPAALARLINVDPAYVSLLRSGKRTRPSAEVVLALAGALQVDHDWLLTGQGEMEATVQEAEIYRTLGKGPAGAFRSTIRDQGRLTNFVGEEALPSPSDYKAAAKKPLAPDPLAAWLVRSMEKGEAVTLARSFLDEYESGDKSALARALTLLQILADSPKA